MYRWGAQWGQCLRHTTNEFFFCTWNITTTISLKIMRKQTEYLLFLFLVGYWMLCLCSTFFHLMKRGFVVYHTVWWRKKSVLHELLNVFDQNGNKTSGNRKRNYCWTVATRHEHMCTSFVVNICSFFSMQNVILTQFSYQPSDSIFNHWIIEEH